MALFCCLYCVVLLFFGFGCLFVLLVCICFCVDLNLFEFWMFWFNGFAGLFVI